MRGPGWECVSGADKAWIGTEGAWKSSWFDVVSAAESKEEVFCIVKIDSVSDLQCCCWGVVGYRSVGAVQWLCDCVCVSAVMCDCVSLVACERNDASVFLLWLSRDSWMMISAQQCPSWRLEASKSLLMMSVFRISHSLPPGLGLKWTDISITVTQLLEI